MLLDILEDALIRLRKLIVSTNPPFSPDAQGVKAETALLDSGYKLPEELRRFYDWWAQLPTGTWLREELFPLAAVMTLENAIGTRQDLLSINRQAPRELRAEIETWSQQPIIDRYAIAEPVFGWHKQWLPVFEFNGEYWFTICDIEERLTSPIYHTFLEGGIFLAYDNLTTLLLSTAEAFECGVYYIQDQRIQQHYTLAASLIDKHNPLRRAYLLNTAGAQTIHDVVTVLASQDAERSGLAYQALRLLGDPEIPQILQGLLQHQDMIVRLQAVRLISEREEFSAMDALRRAVDDPDPEVRGYVAWTLQQFQAKGYG